MKIKLLWRPGVSLLVLASAFSQNRNLQPAPAQESPDVPVLRVTVNLVQVDAVVTDSKGKPVTTLTADDFELLQDGKRQKITKFSYISTAAPTPTPVVAPKPAGPAGRVTPPPPTMRLRPDQVRRTIAMVVDDLGLSFESTAQIRSALKKFVDQQMQPGDLVAIIRTGAGMGALQQFTSDKRQLYAAIERVKYNMMGRGGVGAFAPINDSPGGASGEGSARLDDFREEYFSRGTLGAINYVVGGLKEMPGRKAVILLSDSIKLFNQDGLNDRILESVRQLTDLANRASVVIYSIDPRGLPTLSLTAADNVNPGRNPARLSEKMQQRHTEYFQSQDGLNYLAQETGGLFVHDTNDISGGIRTVLDDQKGYYLIGYTPDNATFEQLKGKDRKYHKIKVRVKTAGLLVRSRTGFYGVPDRLSRPVYRTREEQLFAALGSPFGGGGVRLRMTALFATNPKQGSFVQSMLHIDGHDLTFTDEPDGWKRAVVDVLLVTFGDNGSVLDQTSQTFTLRARGDTYRSAMEHGFVHTVNHPVKKPGAYQLRTAVRDSTSLKIGSATQFIEVPDISKGRLTLSGIVMRASRPPVIANAAAAASPTPPVESEEAKRAKEREADIESDGNPSMRLFHPGKQVDYAVQILNAQEDPATKRSQLESQLFLYRDGQQIYAGKPKAFQPEKAKDANSVTSAGQLQLGSKMEPGEYAMQIVVTDKLAKEKFRTVAQSIDFEVVK